MLSKLVAATFKFLPSSKSKNVLQIPASSSALSLKQIHQKLSITGGPSLHHFALSQEAFEQLAKFTVLKHLTTRIEYCHIHGCKLAESGLWLMKDTARDMFKLKVSSTRPGGVTVTEVTDQQLILGILNDLTESSEQFTQQHIVPVFSYWYDRYYYILSPSLELYIDVAQFKHNDYYVLGTIKVMTNELESAARMLEELNVIPNARGAIAEGLACHQPQLYKELVSAGVFPAQCFVDKTIQHFEEHPYPDERKRDRETYEFAMSEEFAEDKSSSIEDKVINARIIIEDISDDEEEYLRYLPEDEVLDEKAATAFVGYPLEHPEEEQK